MEPNPLLPANAGEFEQAHALVAAWRLPDVFALVKVLRTLWDPLTCPASELPILAWAWSVDYWRPEWTEARKRRVIAEARLYHSRKTTVAGARMALGYRDAQLVRAYTPRQGVFADPPVSEAENKAWIAGLPEIRVYDPAPAILARRPGGFIGVSCFVRGDARLARRAVLLRDGVETPLRVIPLADPKVLGDRLVFPIARQKVMIVGRAGNAFAASAIPGVQTAAVRLGSGSDYYRNAVTPGDQAAFVQSRRRQIPEAKTVFTPVAKGGRMIVAPVAIARGYVSLLFSDQAGRLASRAPLNVLGKSRVMRAPYTANYLVDWSRQVPRSRLPPGRRVAASSEPIVRELMSAVADSQAMRDQNSLSLKATRRLSYQDIRAMKSGARYGDRRGN